MALRVYWTDFAKAALHDIFDYYSNQVSVRVSLNLVRGLITSTEILKEQPFIGKKEVLLSHKSEGFRYLVYKNYKIIYWINHIEQRVEVVDVFDTRQNPIKIIKK